MAMTLKEFVEICNTQLQKGKAPKKKKTSKKKKETKEEVEVLSLDELNK